MTGWTASSLARLVGIPVPTVSSWVRLGLITPEHVGRGRGGHVIGLTGLMELLAVIELRQAGFDTRDIRRAVENLRSLSGQTCPLARLTLLIAGNDIAWRDAGEFADTAVSALRKPGQRLLILPIGEQHEALIRQLEGRAGDSEAVGETAVRA